jgi:type I restriction enzyme S subunit
MAKDGKSMATPRLRFPEFREGGDWKTERMERLYSFVRNNALSRDKLNYESGTVKNVHYGDIHTKFSTRFDITKEHVPFVNSTEDIPDDDSPDYCVEGDIIFADASEDTNDVGKSIEIVRLNKERLLSGQHTILARRRDNTLIVGFGGYLFRSGQIRSQIQKEAQGTKVYAISSARLANIELAYPRDETEQEKIADCLASLDEVIAAQGQKVEALRAHKRGLTQQLFLREGEAVPRFRFPEFRGKPQWPEVKAGELFANRAEKGEDDLPIYSVTMTDGLVKRSMLERRIDDLADAEGNKKVYKHDIAYNMMRMWQGACGVAYEECMVSPAYVVLSPQRGVHSDFYGYLFKLPQMLQLFNSHSRGLTKDRLRLYYQDFARIPVPRPDIREQRRIADCFHSLDGQIAVEAEKLDALKTHRKSLMQQLLPAPERG